MHLAIPNVGTLDAAPSALGVARFCNSYTSLPARFHERVAPAPTADPRLIKFNLPLAEELGLNISSIDARGLAELFTGNVTPEGAEPLAMAYAGHQFGNFVPQLGDGRAILLGEVIDLNGQRRDIQWKGAGRTPYSRSGDGRAALGPVMREYLVSEAMHALGIPTTRALAAATTGEIVYRDRRLPGAVLTRVAASHVRVGTFQYFAARGDVEAVRVLADYVIDRHYGDVKDTARPYLGLLAAIVERQASLIAHWMGVGFVHGVMNTDNMAVSGQTIDFGPCAFLDVFDPRAVFSSIDRMGRYAYANQPRIAQWNLARLAETLLPLIDPDIDRAIELATETVSGFSAGYSGRWLEVMRAKLGLRTAHDADIDLAREFLDLLHKNEVDFTEGFRRLCDAADSPQNELAVRALFAEPSEFDRWAITWRRRLSEEPESNVTRRGAMRSVNAAVIPRNHRIEEVIVAATTRNDFAPFHELARVLSTPFALADDDAHFADPPLADQRVTETFCGT